MRTLSSPIFSALLIQLTFCLVTPGGRVHRIVQREHHVVGGQRIAIVEGHALADGQIQRLGSVQVQSVASCGRYLPWRGRDSQVVKDLAGNDDAFAHIVMIGAHILRLGDEA